MELTQEALQRFVGGQMQAQTIMRDKSDQLARVMGFCKIKKIDFDDDCLRVEYDSVAFLETVNNSPVFREAELEEDYQEFFVGKMGYRVREDNDGNLNIHGFGDSFILSAPHNG